MIHGNARTGSLEVTLAGLGPELRYRWQSDPGGTGEVLSRVRN